MTNRPVMTVAALREFLDECDPTALVAVHSPESDDEAWAVVEVWDDDGGHWVSLGTAHKVPVVVEP